MQWLKTEKAFGNQVELIYSTFRMSNIIIAFGVVCAGIPDTENPPEIRLFIKNLFPKKPPKIKEKKNTKKIQSRNGLKKMEIPKVWVL